MVGVFTFKERKMKIAIDYDDTFTADPELWRFFIAKAKERGHTVSFVTFRWEPDEGYDPIHNADIKKDAAELDIEIVFTHGQQKANHFDADIWIDDMPEVIPHSKTLWEMYKDCQSKEDNEIKAGWSI